MEYYAKSPIGIISNDKKESLKKTLSDIMPNFPEDEELCRAASQYLKCLESGTVYEHKTLKEHLDEIVRCADEFFSIYGRYFTVREKLLIIEACGLHDIGKANYIFQTKVNSELVKKCGVDEIPHGFLSAMMIPKDYLKCVYDDNGIDCTDENQLDADNKVFLTALFYHHARKYKDEYDEIDAKIIGEYYTEPIVGFLRDTDSKLLRGKKVKLRRSIVQNLLFSDNRRIQTKSMKENQWCDYMLIKGMLNRFDYVVSAGYERAEIAYDIQDKKLCRAIKTKFGKLRPMQRFMAENTEKNAVIVAPTGSGKTEAALLWLNGEKGFYTLPLRVSSNAIYRRIRDHYNYEDIALLHSDSMGSYFENSQMDYMEACRRYEQAKLFSYPLTVCTIDQLFRFVYKVQGTEICAATLKYSKVIIDEIQSYSPRIIAALIFGLKELKLMGGRFAILTGQSFFSWDYLNHAIGIRCRTPALT